MDVVELAGGDPLPHLVEDGRIKPVFRRISDGPFILKVNGAITYGP